MHRALRSALPALAAALLALFGLGCTPQYARPDLTFDPEFALAATGERESAGTRSQYLLFLDGRDPSAREVMVVMVHELPETERGQRPGFTGLAFLELESAEIDRLMDSPVQYMREMDDPSAPLNEIRHGLHWALMEMARSDVPVFEEYRIVARTTRIGRGKTKSVAYLSAPERIEPGDGWREPALQRFSDIINQPLPAR